MHKHFKQPIILLLLILTVTTASGCVALLLGAAAGAATAVYVGGDLEKNFEEDIKTAHKAALAALKAQDVFVTQDTLNLHDASILGEYDDGEKVKVTIKALTERSSKVKVRVGVFGDELKANTVMNAIERKL